jgi:arabinan endo-1,5-alpha-L-arabinosidase
MRTFGVHAKLGGRVVVVLALAAAAVAVGATPSEAAGPPLPVKTVSGTNHDTPDPGVLLYKGKFYAFSTGGGLRESTSAKAGGPWSRPVNRLAKGTLPSWADGAKGIWAPDMIRTTSGMFVVYFSAALVGAKGPAGNDGKPAAAARCIATAESKSPVGPFTADKKPVVCFKQYDPADPMTANPGKRVRGEGVIDASPVLVTIKGQLQLYLVYKTEADPGKGQPATIRMVRLSASTGTTAIGTSRQLLFSTTGVYADTIEAPSLIQHGSYFILFVAHGNFGTCGYSTEWFKTRHIWSWSNNGGSTLLKRSTTRGLCGPGSADVTGSRVAGQGRIFFHAWVKEHNGVISTTPLPPKVVPKEGSNAARVMYAAVLTFASNGFTPIVGPYQGQ